MAKNFKILRKQDNARLHLKLQGDFDGTSAFELINTLKETIQTAEIIIHAEDLSSVHPFGSEVFEKHIYEFKGTSAKIFFTGRINAFKMRSPPLERHEIDPEDLS